MEYDEGGTSANKYFGSAETKSFSDFVEQVEIFGLVDDLVLFRGQSVCRKLLPKVARADHLKDTTEAERAMLLQLRLQGASFLPSAVTDWDLLILAQHFGMNTRLLDWTTNPLAALWFACASKSPGNVYVYALVADSLQSIDYTDNPFGLESTRVIQPKQNNPRIVAQHGWFTAHRYSKSANMFVALEYNQKLKRNLQEFRIPDASRPAILRSLERHGVNERTLFPDLQGLCGYLNWKYPL